MGTRCVKQLLKDPKLTPRLLNHGNAAWSPRQDIAGKWMQHLLISWMMWKYRCWPIAKSAGTSFVLVQKGTRETPTHTHTLHWIVLQEAFYLYQKSENWKPWKVMVRRFKWLQWKKEHVWNRVPEIWCFNRPFPGESWHGYRVSHPIPHFWTQMRCKVWFRKSQGSRQPSINGCSPHSVHQRGDAAVECEPIFANVVKPIPQTHPIKPIFCHLGY